MTRTELFKLRTHRTPWVLLAILVTSLAVAPTYFAIKNPTNRTDLTDALGGVFAVMAPLLGAVLGGWVIGHEFRQGTLRRVLGSDARRSRLIATKAAVGLGALTLAMATAAAFGAVASIASAASFGETLVWDGVLRNILSTGFLALLTATIAMVFSILFRSDTYAMLGAIALTSIVGPLLTLIPTIGKYTPSALATDVSLSIAGSGELGVTIVTATLGLTATIGALATAATALFHRIDI